MMSEAENRTAEIEIEKLVAQLPAEVEEQLRKELRQRQDVAFAHLTQALVPGHQNVPTPMLSVWLNREAMRSVRLSLKLVSNVVARALPKDVFVDVIILNSAPELLEQVEKVGLLLVENDSEERQSALRALSNLAEEVPAPVEPTRRWWWPF
jgi:hypothetical protein